MSNTTIMNGNTIEITPDGSTDWLWNAAANSNIPAELRNMKNGWFLRRIRVKASAANDVIIVRDGGIDGAAIFDTGAATGAVTLTHDFKGQVPHRPVIDASDCTFGTAGNVRIYIDLL